MKKLLAVLCAALVPLSSGMPVSVWAQATNDTAAASPTNPPSSQPDATATTPAPTNAAVQAPTNAPTQSNAAAPGATFGVIAAETPPAAGPAAFVGAAVRTVLQRAADGSTSSAEQAAPRRTTLYDLEDEAGAAIAKVLAGDHSPRTVKDAEDKIKAVQEVYAQRDRMIKDLEARQKADGAHFTPADAAFLEQLQVNAQTSADRPLVRQLDMFSVWKARARIAAGDHSEAALKDNAEKKQKLFEAEANQAMAEAKKAGAEAEQATAEVQKAIAEAEKARADEKNAEAEATQARDAAKEALANAQKAPSGWWSSRWGQKAAAMKTADLKQQALAKKLEQYSAASKLFAEKVKAFEATRKAMNDKVEAAQAKVQAADYRYKALKEFNLPLLPPAARAELNKKEEEQAKALSNDAGAKTQAYQESLFKTNQAQANALVAQAQGNLRADLTRKPEEQMKPEEKQYIQELAKAAQAARDNIFYDPVLQATFEYLVDADRVKTIADAQQRKELEDLGKKWDEYKNESDVNKRIALKGKVDLKARPRVFGLWNNLLAAAGIFKQGGADKLKSPQWLADFANHQVRTMEEAELRGFAQYIVGRKFSQETLHNFYCSEYRTSQYRHRERVGSAASSGQAAGDFHKNAPQAIARAKRAAGISTRAAAQGSDETAKAQSGTPFEGSKGYDPFEDINCGAAPEVPQIKPQKEGPNVGNLTQETDKKDEGNKNKDHTKRDNYILAAAAGATIGGLFAVAMAPSFLFVGPAALVGAAALVTLVWYATTDHSGKSSASKDKKK